MRRLLPLLLPLIAIIFAGWIFWRHNAVITSTSAVITEAPRVLLASQTGILHWVSPVGTPVRQGDRVAAFDANSVTSAMEANDSAVIKLTQSMPPLLSDFSAELYSLKPSATELSLLVEQAQKNANQEQERVVDASGKHIAVRRQVLALEIKEQLTPAERAQLESLHQEEAALTLALETAKNNRELANAGRAALEKNWQRKRGLEKALSTLPQKEYNAVIQLGQLLDEGDRLQQALRVANIYTDQDGIILQILAEVGDTLEAQRPLLLIGTNTPFIVQAEFTPDDARRLSVGTRCTIRWHTQSPIPSSSGYIRSLTGARAIIEADLPSYLLLRQEHTVIPIEQIPAKGQPVTITVD